MKQQWLNKILYLKEKYETFWREEPDSYWYCRLIEEISELANALFGNEKDTPEHELMQIIAICLNFLEKRENEKTLSKEN